MGSIVKYCESTQLTIFTWSQCKPLQANEILKRSMVNPCKSDGTLLWAIVSDSKFNTIPRGIIVNQCKPNEILMATIAEHCKW